MDNSNFIEFLSHKINEIMLRFFKKEEYLEKLFDCVETTIIFPRYELMSTIDVLGEYMLEKNKNDEQKIKDTKKKAETWLLSSENKNFSKLWANKEVPEKIQEMYRFAFGLDVTELLEKYVINFDEFIQKKEEKEKKYLEKWFKTSKKESEKIVENLDQVHLNQLDKDKDKEQQDEFDKKFLSGKSFKERQKEQEDAAIPQSPKSKKIQKIEKNVKNVELRHSDSIQELKKGDKARFAKIFYAFEKKIGKMSEETKSMITRLWYGDYYAQDDPNSDDILNLVKRYSLTFKISNNHINSEVNRLILQTYIVGLYTGVTVFHIYTIINEVLEANPTMTVHNITPDMIHNGNVPSLKIQEVLNEIIKNLPLNENQSIIRANWNKMRFPYIDISDLVIYLKQISMDDSVRFKIIKQIEDLSEEIVTTGLTIPKFARKVYQILKKQTMKIPITEKEIVELLKYE